MKKLAYTSKRLEKDEATLQAMLQLARERNRSEDITGVLLYDDTRFVQLLEGDYDSLARCFLRIARSPLHTDIEIAVLGDGVARLFADWDMRSVDVSKAGTSLRVFWKRLMAEPEAQRLQTIEQYFMKQHRP